MIAHEVPEFICYGLMLIASIQAFYFFAFFLRILFIRKKDFFGSDYAQHCLSVIICAKNEAINLSAFLPQILSQNYLFENGEKAFEVIVVNDASDDDTATILNALSVGNPHLKVVSIPAGMERKYPGKKMAISFGLAAAQHEWVVCTDADCSPASSRWLHLMAAPLMQGKEIVAGYGGYISAPGALNKFIRYETLHTFLQMYAFTKSGLPYMATGRNLAAKKNLFLKAQMHPVWSLLPSGDDDLLVQLCGSKNNVGIVTHPNSFTWSAAKSTFSEYVGQKQRHVSTGKFYTAKSKLLLGVYAISASLWWPFFIAFCFRHSAEQIWLIVFALLTFVGIACVFQNGTSRVHERTSVVGWIGFSIGWIVYNTFLAPYILWKSKQRWT